MHCLWSPATKSTIVEAWATQAEEAAPIRLRGGIGKAQQSGTQAVAAVTEDSCDSVPWAQQGARKAVSVFLGVPVFVLLIMLVAQRSGGFYPAGCFCVFVLGLFASMHDEPSIK